MFSRRMVRAIALVLVGAMMSGCAEINKRGGFVAEIEDVVLFTAHTKSHRLFRSFMLIGVLLAAARHGSHNETDKTAIDGNLKAALAVAYEAYECLYMDPTTVSRPDWINVVTALRVAPAAVPTPATPAPATQAPVPATTGTVAKEVAKIGTVGAITFNDPMICQFFDEKMARLDYALYRLALSSLFNEKAKAQLNNIRDKLVGELPVLTPSVKAAIFASRAVNQASTIVDDLLNLSFESLGPVITLLPLYRDALEMNMWVVVDTLTRRVPDCPDDAPLRVERGVVVPEYDLTCQTKQYARYILSNGNGRLPDWRNFVWNMNYVGASVEAYAPHFALVSRFIWRSCRHLLTASDCGTLMTAALDKAIGESIRVEVKLNDQTSRIYSASVRSRSQFARTRSAVPPSDNVPTGSIKPPAASPAPTPPR